MIFLKSELLNDLDIRVSDLVQTNRIIWVEEPSDRIYVKRWLQLAGMKFEEDGRCPVQELLDSLAPKLLAKTLRTIDLLEMNGSWLHVPYSKPLENGIFELRTKQE